MDRASERTAALPRDLVRVLAWSRAHLCEPVRLEGLARIAGVPRRTLETHFRRFLGMTPMSWMRLANGSNGLLLTGLLRCGE